MSAIKTFNEFINESIWNSRPDISRGTFGAKKVITTNRDLQKKIEELYKEQGEGDTLDVSSLTNLINRCYDFSHIFKGYRDVIQIIGLEDWDVSHVEDMSGMFAGCYNFNSDLSKWDVSNVKDMRYMFEGCENFNCDLSKWDVHHVEVMGGMFYYCREFNSDLSKWNVSNVKDMRYMFKGCKSLKQIPSWYKNKGLNESIWNSRPDMSRGTFGAKKVITTNEDLQNRIHKLYEQQGEGDTLDVSSLTNLIKCDDFSYIFEGYSEVKQIIGLEDWDVSKVTNMRGMFHKCYDFNPDLSKWDVSNVVDMSYMFCDCYNFNSDLSNWDVRHVVDMSYMFYHCEKFNSDLSKWDVSNVVDMGGMFDGCESFNSNLSKWNVSNVKFMKGMFSYCEKFNSDLSNWDVRNVKNMEHMFWYCYNFNSDLSNWDVSNVEHMKNMLDNCKSLKIIPSWYKDK